MLAFELDSFVKFPETENWRKELLLAREVLKCGVPSPDDEQWKKNWQYNDSNRETRAINLRKAEYKQLSYNIYCPLTMTYQNITEHPQ